LRTAFLRFLLCSGLVFAGVIAVAWLYVANCGMAFLESGYPSWVAKTAILRDCSLGRIAFFGDSRVDAGVVPMLLPVPASNLGLPAGTAIETRSAVRRALKCPTTPRQVVISLTAEHFGPLDKFFWIDDLRYSFISYNDLWHAENLAAALADHRSFTAARTPEGLSGRVRDWVYALHFPSVYFASLVQARLIGRYGSNRTRVAAVLASHGFWPFGASSLDAPRPREPDSFEKFPLQAAEFEQTLGMLNARHIDVGLLFMPVVQTETVHPAFEKAYLAYMRSMTRRYPNVHLIDPDLPRWPARMFVDGEHLTGAGAQLFTELLAACMADGRITPGCNLQWQDKGLAVSTPAPPQQSREQPGRIPRAPG